MGSKWIYVAILGMACMMLAVNGTDSSNSTEITGRDNCRRDRACFSAPPTCNPGAQDSCYFLSTKGITGNADNFTFELSGESDGYIAAGLSRDSSGQGATIYSCANFNGVLRFIRATLNSQRLTQDNTFIPGSFRGSVNGRKIQCIFNAAGLGSSTARAATTETFVFVLTGSVSNGSLDSPVSRLATNGSVDLGNPNSTDAAIITPSTNATASNATATSNTTASNTTTVSTNLTQTRPPNITMNMTQPGPLNMTTNSTQTRPPNMTNNVTPSGSNTMTNNNIISQSQEITSRDNCRRDRACFSAPPTCNPGAQSSCYFLSTRGITGNADNFTFELSGESDGYIAAGLSRDSTGQGATIYSCANFNGVPRFIRATLNNQRLTQDNTFIPGSFRGSVIGKKIQCVFNAAGLGSSTTRAATTEPFVFVLTGSVSNGSLDSPVTRLATNGSVDLSNPNSTDVSVITPSTNATASNTTAASNATASNATASSNATAASNATATSNATSSNVTANTGTTIDKVTRDSCKKDKACFSTPASCDPSTSNSCFFVSTRGVNGSSDNLTFELSGESNGYIAVGLSRDNKEGDGDTIYSCANNNGMVKFIRATLNNTILTPDNTFGPGSFRGSVNNTKIQCIFIATGLNSNTRAANTNAYLFFFTGNFTNGTMGSPFTRMATNSSVDLTNINSSDVAIITPTTNTASNTTTSTTTAKPTTVGSNTLQHVASQAAVVILSGILAVLLL